MQDAVVNLIRVSLRDHQRFGAADAARAATRWAATVPSTTYPCAPGGPNDYVFIIAQPQMWPAVRSARSASRSWPTIRASRRRTGAGKTARR